jgi:hypothetical protein
MKQAPPFILEKLITLLTPPACREHVLGDLYELYRTPWQYIVDAALALPFVVLGRIRRTTDTQVFFIEAFTLYLCFLAASWRLDGAAFLNEHAGFWRLAIPAVAWLVALLMANAYSDASSRHAPLRDSVFGALAALFSQAVLKTTGFDLLVPATTMLSGAGLGMLLISALRVVFAPSSAAPAMPAGSVEPKQIARKNRPPLWTLVIWTGALLSLSYLFHTEPRLLIPSGALLLLGAAGVRSLRAPYTGLGWVFYAAVAVIFFYWAALRKRRKARR